MGVTHILDAQMHFSYKCGNAYREINRLSSGVIFIAFFLCYNKEKNRPNTDFVTFLGSKCTFCARSLKMGKLKDLSKLLSLDDCSSCEVFLVDSRQYLSNVVLGRNCSEH